MKKSILLISLLVAINIILLASTMEKNFTLETKAGNVRITLPDTWKLDEAESEEMKVSSVFIPAEFESAEDSDIRIFFHAADVVAGEKTSAQLMAEELARMDSQYKIKCKKQNWKLVNEQGYSVEVFLLDLKNEDVRQYIAYVVTPDGRLFNFSLVMHEVEKVKGWVDAFRGCLESVVVEG